MLPMIISKIPGLGQYATLLRGALCIAKVWAGIKMAQASPKYLSSDKKGRVLMIAGSIASQVLQCFAVLKGKRFLTGIINKLSMVVANLAYKNEPATVLAATTATAATTAAIADAGVTDASVIEELHNPEVSMDEKVELLKDADVPEEQITKITKAVETETAAKTALKSEATEAVNKANQEQMAAAAAEKQQPAQVTDNNVNSVEQTPTEVASSQPVKTANNEQVAVNDQTQEQPIESTNTDQVATINNQQTQTVAIQPQQPVENKPAYDTGTGSFLRQSTVSSILQNQDTIRDYKRAETEWNAGNAKVYRDHIGYVTGSNIEWDKLSNEEQAKVMWQTTGTHYGTRDVADVENIIDDVKNDKIFFDQKQAEAAAAEQARIDAENARLEAERQAKLEAIRAENERVQLERQTQQNAEKQDAINTLKAQSAGYELAKSQLPRSDRQGRKEINQLIRGNKKAIKQLS